MTKFSVVFIHKLQCIMQKKRRENEGEKRLETKKKRAKQNDKIKKTLVAVFAEYEFN